MKVVRAVLPVMFGLVVLSACGTTTGKTTDSAGVGTNGSAGKSAEAAASASKAVPVNPKLGAAYTFEDGLAVTVSVPKPFTPSVNSYAKAKAGAIVFDIRVVNGSKKNFDPVLFHATLQSGNAEAEAIYDTASGVGGGPSTVVLPGREVAFKIAFSATNPADLVMQVRPGFEYKPAIFTS